MIREYIKVQLTLLAPEQGGRQTPIVKAAFGGNYRPHIVIGNPDQREPILVERDGVKNYIDEEYLGVAFWQGPDTDVLPNNKSIELVLVLSSFPNVQYEKVISCATFTMREGGRIIGCGRIDERWADKIA